MMAAARSISGGGGEARRGKPLMAQAIDKKPERGGRVCIGIVHRVIEQAVQMRKTPPKLPYSRHPAMPH